MFFTPKRDRPTLFALTKLKRKPHIKHHSQADGLRTRLKVPKSGVFFIRRGYKTARPVSSLFCLTVPNSEFLVSHARHKPTLPASTKFNLTLTQRILILTKRNHGQTVFSMEA